QPIIPGETCLSASPPTTGSEQHRSKEIRKTGHFYFAENRTFLFSVDKIRQEDCSNSNHHGILVVAFINVCFRAV
ncbi:MAG: hypothetical protein Q8R74_06340, partial [Methylophilus sp.]|nr:hypothetical protein [Methylophilus sp.]